MNELKTLLQSHDVVYLASDLDHEGEAIASLPQLFKNQEYKWMTFNEITQDVVVKVFNNSCNINLT